MLLWALIIKYHKSDEMIQLENVDRLLNVLCRAVGGKLLLAYDGEGFGPSEVVRQRYTQVSRNTCGSQPEPGRWRPPATEHWRCPLPAPPTLTGSEEDAGGRGYRRWTFSERPPKHA